MKLVIVESPNKTKSIQQYLKNDNDDYHVLASYGNIRDIAKSGTDNLGVDIEHDFKPTYEVLPSKRRIVSRLKNEVEKADEVYLATDPDREGEAISWHLYEVLGLKDKLTKRLEFNEITRFGIENGLNNLRDINRAMVDSQETRRIMDRIIGFRLSKFVQHNAHSKSAGRVQSAVLRFVIEREKEIKDFKPVDTYYVNAKIDDKYTFKVMRRANEDLKLNSEEEANEVLNGLGKDGLVSKIKYDQQEIKSRIPLITSELQVEAARIYHFGVSSTMAAAQALFEGVRINGKLTGLITYIRTDSYRLSPIFINQTKNYIRENYGEEYVGKAHVQRKKVQDAHEAIRPTDINLSPDKVKEYLSPIQYRIYQLIYMRALSSLMKPEIKRIQTVVVKANDYELEYKGEEVLFPGFRKVDKANKENVSKFLKYQEGEEVKIGGCELDHQVSKAPSRYSEGSLVKKMEDSGIGRPSTYVSTITNLKDHRYIYEGKNHLLEPTEQGMVTDAFLRYYFSDTINAKYTARLEEELDGIASSSVDKLSILKKLNEDFEKELQGVHNKEKPNIEIEKPLVGKLCPDCGSPLIYRYGPKGKFIACSNYPTCHHTENLEEEPAKQGRLCPKCKEGHLVVRRSARGNFLACDHYPNCDYTESFKKRYYKKTAK